MVDDAPWMPGCAVRPVPTMGGRLVRGTAPIRAAAAGLRARVSGFRAAEGAIATLEFAITLPTLLLILFAGIQVVAYVDATRKVDLVAHSISQMISQATPPANASIAKVNATDLHFSYDAALVLFPYAMKDAKRRGIAWWQSLSINYAGIQFVEKSTTCQNDAANSADLSACYDAKVVWTSTGTSQPSDGANYRTCDAPQQAADDSAPPNRATLPRSSFGPASLVVIDVVFNFTPTFGSGFVPAVRIARSAYVQPRYATLVSYDTTNNDGIASKCSGY